MSAQRAVRVVTEVAAVDREFDYLVPDGMVVGVGDRVRLDFHGRSVRAWVLEDDIPLEGRELKSIGKWLGYGPPLELIPFLQWASEYWVTPLARALSASCTMKLWKTLPPAPKKATVEHSGPTYAPGLWQCGPTRDPLDIVLSALTQTYDSRGSLLVLTPTEGWAERLATRLAHRGIPVAKIDEWDKCRSEWPVIVGARGAAFAPTPRVAGVVVLDGDDDAYVAEQSPTWNAVRAVAHRAERDNAPLWVTSPMPSPLLLDLFGSVNVDDDIEGRWPRIEVLDRRLADPRDGALSQEALRAAHTALDAVDGIAVAVILQRLGAGRLLACRRCGELFRCASCGEAEVDVDGLLQCRHAHAPHEPFCRDCGATKPRSIRSGVTTLARDVALQLGQPVLEVTATSEPPPSTTRVVVGTEAIFRHVRRCGVVIFVDFDQYLLGTREEARRDAVYAVAKAGRLVGGRRDGRGLVVVQTRRGGDDVLQSLRVADFAQFMQDEVVTAELLDLPPFGALAEIGGVAGPAYAAALRDAGVAVQAVGERFMVRAPSNGELRALLARAERPTGAMRLAIS